MIWPQIELAGSVFYCQQDKPPKSSHNGKFLKHHFISVTVTMFNIYKWFCTSKYLNTWQGSWIAGISVFRSSGQPSGRRERHIKAKAHILESCCYLLLRQHSTTSLPGTISLGIWGVLSKAMLDEEQSSYCCTATLLSSWSWVSTIKCDCVH